MTNYKYRRIIPTETPYVIRATKLAVFAVNSTTREALYGDQYNLYLVSLLSNSLVCFIPIVEFFKQELSRYAEKRQQDFVNQYAFTSLNWLFSLEKLNIWVIVVNKRKLVFLSDSLELSAEHNIDNTGILGCYVSRGDDLIFTLTGDGKIQVWSCEINFDTGKKRQSEFEVRLTIKKLIPAGAFNFTKLSVSESIGSSLVAAANTAGEVHVYDYINGGQVVNLTPSDPSKPHITALALRVEFIVYADRNLTFVVYSLTGRVELIRMTLPESFIKVEKILIETDDTAAGVLLLDSCGTLHDYSIRSKDILSSITLRAFTEQMSASPLTAERQSFAATGKSASMMDSKQIARAPRYTNFWYLDCDKSGTRQLWVVYNRCLEVIKLLAIAHVVPVRYPISYIRPLSPLNPGSDDCPLACVTPTHDIILIKANLGVEVTFTPSLTTNFKRQQDQEAFSPEHSDLFYEANTLFTISDQGCFRTYDIDSNSASKDFKIAKQVISCITLVPKYPALETLNKQVKQDFYFILGNTHGAVKVVEYDAKQNSFSFFKRYAAFVSVVSVSYIPSVRKVAAIGREGLVKFLLCDEGYEWDSLSFNGTWENVSAAALCGVDTILLGYESGMVQSCYFGDFTGSPLISLLEFHRGRITEIQGLKLTNKEAVSADSLGLIVLWNLDQESPFRVFSMLNSVSSLSIFGARCCESIFIVQYSKILQLHISAAQPYVRLNLRIVKEFKQEVKAKRLKTKSAKVLPMRSVKDAEAKALKARNFNKYLMHYSSEVLALGSLKTRVQKAREYVSRDILTAFQHENRRTTSTNEAKDSIREQPFFKRPRRPATKIIEHNRKIREKKQVALSIKRQGVEVPRELLALTKVTTAMFTHNAERPVMSPLTRMSSPTLSPLPMSPHPKPRISILTHGELKAANIRPKTTTMKDLFFSGFSLSLQK